MPQGRNNARVHLIQIDQEKPRHGLLDAPEGVGPGCSVFLYDDTSTAWIVYLVQAGEIQRHAIPLTRVCGRCAGTGWICEDHPDLPPPHACGAALMPCPICNTEDPPRMPPGFVSEV